MTDTTDPIVPVTTEAPAATDAPVDYSTHPVWSKAVEAIPEVLRGPLYETIRASETESQRAIEKARNETVPAEWRELYQEANEMGLGVEAIAGAYVSQTELQALLQSDPDAFVSTLSAQVDQLVASGQITRKEGAAAKREVEAVADEQTDALLTPAEKQVKELQARMDARDAEDQRREQAAAAQRQQAQQDAQLEQEAERYFQVFDQEMQTAGLVAADASGVLRPTIPVETLQLIAKTGGELLDANPRLSHQQAAQQALATVKRQVEAVGGKLGPQAPAAMPVIGGSAAMPGGHVKPDGPRSFEDRESAALAALRQMQAE